VSEYKNPHLVILGKRGVLMKKEGEKTGKKLGRSQVPVHTDEPSVHLVVSTPRYFAGEDASVGRSKS